MKTINTTEPLCYALLAKYFVMASFGPSACHWIACSSPIFERIVDMILQSRTNPETQETELTGTQKEWRRKALAKETPVLFLGATVTTGDDLGDAAFANQPNEIQFLNILRPERDLALFLEGPE